MIDRDRFVAARQDRWTELEDLLLPTTPKTAARISRVSSLYRSVAADLATAQSSELADDIVGYLDQLAAAAHNEVYGGRSRARWRPIDLLARRFPIALRRQWAFFLLANVLFYGPFFLGWVACFLEPSLAENVLPPSQLDMMESMYSGDPTDRGGSDADAQMAGFYVLNNIGIALRCFATGALGGLGSLFFLIYNGAVLGTTFGYVTAGPGAYNLLTFACGHAAWELTGIVVSGAAGLRMGWVLLVPGERTRVGSLLAARDELFAMAMGAVALLAVAAMVEGFWSASPLTTVVEWPFAAGQFPIVFAWLAFGGRR